MSPSCVVLVGLMWLVAGQTGPGPTEASPLDLKDLAGYEAALHGEGLEETAPQPVSFRDLWIDPDTHAGDIVIVAGRMERIFRQREVGALPALCEAWLMDREGNPLCVVYPWADGEAKLGEWVSFQGRFLRMVRYQGGDAARVAPLIVGSASPLKAAEVAREPEGIRLPLGHDAWLAALLGGLVFVLLVLPRARRRRRIEREVPPPTFEGPDGPGENREREGTDG